MKSILIRADGNNKIGMGHVIRCLNLADRLKTSISNLDIAFVTEHDIAKNIIKERDYRVFLTREIDSLSDIASDDGVIITDFLDTDNNYISKIKSTLDSTIICIDNNPKLKHIDADIVINANVFNCKDYLELGPTRYYLGPKYMILKDVFAKLRDEKNRKTEK